VDRAGEFGSAFNDDFFQGSFPPIQNNGYP